MLSFVTRLSVAVITLISSIVIARLLTPAEMGVYAIGLTLRALLDVFREFGIGNYLVQEKQLTREKVRAAFSVTLSLFGAPVHCLWSSANLPLASMKRQHWQG